MQNNQYRSKILALLGFIASVKAQGACTLNAEDKPTITWQTCTSSGCTTNDGYLTIDANWRWTHALDSDTNCYTGNTWDTTLCPTDEECAANCCLDGSGGYEATYGVSTSGDAATLNFVTENSSGENVGSRLYLMSSETEYEMFDLLGKEFTFDVDVSTLACGLNGALYFVDMASDGGLSQYSTNLAGAEYGTGYCDTQCAMDLKWINGLGNVQGWTPSTNNANTGVGQLGSCCNEIDIWEANSMATALTLHSCETTSQHECNGTTCGGTYAENRYGGDCDPDGCDWNPYRNGDTTFFGPGLTVDTDSVVTVVTQFLTDDSGDLDQVVRFYVQNDVLITNPVATDISGFSGNSITDDYCVAEHSAFGEVDYFDERGGFTSIQTGIESGMVLVLSLWDDYYADMLWLDSDYPTNESSSTAGVARGPCSTSSGVPSEVESEYASAAVIFSNIKFGSINSTFTYTSVLGGTGTSTTSTSSASSAKTTTTSSKTTLSTSKTTTTTVVTTTTSAAGGTQSEYGQCGGSGWTGPTACASPYTCQVENPYYYQCL